jgi:hypothetical protein
MQPLAWSALEYEHRQHSSDWFWTLGIIGLGGAILAIVFSNVLFALFIVLGAVTLGLHAIKHPRVVSFEINDRGIVVDGTLFPYATLESYDIHDHHRIPRLVIKSQKLVMPHITVPIEEVTPEDVYNALSDKLPMIEVPETLAEKLMEAFGL